MWTIILSTLFSFLAMGADYQEGIWSTQEKRMMSLADFVDSRGVGQILVMGEEHATDENRQDPEVIWHHFNQVRLISRLNTRGENQDFAVSTGMEFFAYPSQWAVDELLALTLSEEDFLREVEWSGNTFDLYREQVMMPVQSGGQTLALNIPMSISAQVARGGPDSLNPAQRKFLPPIWERGSAAYEERFRESMGGHDIPPDRLANYFWAQSLWDDTMAWNARNYMAGRADRMMVIIVGGFHAEFGHGLPARLLAHGMARDQVKTLLQVPVPDFSPETLARVTAEHARYGARADFLWVYTK